MTSPLSGPLWPMGLCHSSASKYSRRVLPMGEPPAAADAMAAAAEGLDVDTPIVSPEKSIIQRRDKKRAFAMTLSIPDPAAEEEDGDVRKYSIHTPASVNARLGGGTAAPGGAPWQAAEGYLSAGPLSRSGNRLVLPTIMSDRASDVGSPVPPMGRLTPLKSPMRSPKPARVLRPPPTPDNKLPPPVVHFPPPTPDPGSQTASCGNCIERDGASASHWASYNGHLRCLELLLDGQNEELRVDARGRTALFYAVGQGHFDVTALLLDLRPEWMDQADNKGDTPVHVASCYGQASVLSLLMESAADPNMRNNRGFTPAHVTGSEECLSALLNYGADLMQGDKMGRTPLFCAAATSRLGCVRHLCHANGDYAASHHGRNFVDCADYRGDTPLHAAVCNDNVECVEILLQYCLDPSHKNGQGLTPLDLVRRIRRDEWEPGGARADEWETVHSRAHFLFVLSH